MNKTFLNTIMITVFALVITGCKNENNKEAETGDSKLTTTANAEAVQYNVDASESVIEWEGNKPTGAHTGTIKLSEGSFKANDSVVESGKFVIDMNSIVVTDLEGEDKANLEAHLKGTVEGKEGDFFNVNEFPNASFEVTGYNAENSMLEGNLTLKGETKNIQFPVLLNRSEDKLEIISDEFSIDRTKWNVNYGSKSIFEGLGDKFINDQIELKIKLVAKKA